MKMIFKAFSKNFFGARYEILKRTIIIIAIMFWGLYMADFQVQIAPFVFYLTVTAFTGGVMWQALSSEDNSAGMQNMVMLPFKPRAFVFSYIGALGAYTFWTKTAVLLAVLLAVSVWNPVEIFGGILCAANAILMAAAIFSRKKYGYIGCLWIAAVLAALLFLWDKPWFLLVLIVNIILSFFLLYNVDGYAFYRPEGKNSRIVKAHSHYSIWRYLFRYLTAHKNYLMNTAVLWCAACVLPMFFGQLGGLFAAPIGFAILSLNTPICILLSCDPAFEQAVRFLPGSPKAFCVPYGLFIFSFNMAANMIFLCSWQIQLGGVTAVMILTAVFFAMQSAIGSVLLEWFYPIRGWKIESDLWHHPRKYIVPVTMLLIAGIVGAMPMIMPVLMILLIIEITVLLLKI